MAKSSMGGRKKALTAEIRREIASKIAAGVAYTTLVREYGVSKGTITNIKNEHRAEVLPERKKLVEAAVQGVKDAAILKLDQRIGELERVKETTIALEEALRAEIVRSHKREDGESLRKSASALNRAIVSHAIVIDKLLLLEGKPGRITEQRTSTIDIVQLVKLVEDRLGEPLPGKIIDAIGELDG